MRGKVCFYLILLYNNIIAIRILAITYLAREKPEISCEITRLVCFCVFKGCGWDERDVELMDEDFGIDPNDYNYKELHGLGFITDSEKTKYEVELLKRKRAKEVQDEVETLKKLKAKYPNM